MKEVSKEEYKALIDEVLRLQKTLTGHLGVYAANTIIRLIDARIELLNSTVKGESKP